MLRSLIKLYCVCPSQGNGYSLSALRVFCSSRVHQQDKNLSCTSASSDGKAVSVVEKFVNRNPRNLEFLGIAQKRLGWRFQYPPKSYYHKVVFELSPRHTSAFVEHSSGKQVISASTRELAILRHLYSTTDVSAAENIGRVLAQRCLQFGISSMVLYKLENADKSEKFTSFCKALTSGGIELTEPDEAKPDYEPGIDYDNPETVEDLQRRQSSVYHLGEKSATMKALNSQRGLRHGRRRFRGRPIRLEAPDWQSS